MNEEQIYKYAKLRMDKSYTLHLTPEQSEWQCYLFGNRPGGVGMVYRPSKGMEPSWFVRWMMKICFDCLWMKER